MKKRLAVLTPKKQKIIKLLRDILEITIVPTEYQRASDAAEIKRLVTEIEATL